MRVGEMLVPEAVLTNIGAASIDAAVTELVGALGRARGVDVEMAMAGHLAITGCQVNLFNRSPDRIVAI